MVRRTPTKEQIRQNPTLHPLAFDLVSTRFPELKWHSHADSPDSSQAFALSAFLPVLTFPDKDALLERFVESVFPVIPHRADREWQVTPEFAMPELLGETGLGTATNIDILLSSEDAVVCIESKFRVDAQEGFGRCRQATTGACGGYHGPGSDMKTGTDAWCRLTVQDGRRDPRRYWEVGHGHFRDEVFVEQSASETCPFRDTYQLMRNYLTASLLAERRGQTDFGVMGLVPRGSRAALADGVHDFKTDVAMPSGADRVAVADYEDWVSVLEVGSEQAGGLASFLRPLLTGVSPSRA